MAPRPARRSGQRSLRNSRLHRRSRLSSIQHFARTRLHQCRRFLRALRNSHPVLRIPVSASLIFFLWLGLNWMYHAINKPTEVLFPLEDALDKIPAATWQEYGSLFREHSTAIITPELLAALAQAEGAGNPVARTYWRWRPSWNPFEWYRPASSAVGMFQITDGTFRNAKRYCIHNHVVVEEGAWRDKDACWFNSLYTRVLPSHAIELTAALLDRNVASAMGPRRTASITRQQKQDLAALIHLCGTGAGPAFVARGFRMSPHQRCGDHDASLYLARINRLKQQFARLATGGRLHRLQRGP